MVIKHAISHFRTAFTYLSGISTCAVAWVIFGLDSKSQISENSSKDFMVKYLVFIFISYLIETMDILLTL